jgi:hypothetical protein
MEDEMSQGRDGGVASPDGVVRINCRVGTGRCGVLLSDDTCCGDVPGGRASTHALLRAPAAANDGFVLVPLCSTHERLIDRAEPGWIAARHPMWWAYLPLFGVLKTDVSACDFPGTLWIGDENRCALDDSGADPFTPGAIDRAIRRGPGGGR